MTDLEISKALALTIGWPTAWEVCEGAVVVTNGRFFDYRDWNVIGPIAEKYNAFPLGHSHNRGWLSNRAPLGCAHLYYADTPQKAIALAVIGAKK